MVLLEYGYSFMYSYVPECDETGHDYGNM